MAAAFCLRAFLFLQLLLVCIGQYSYYDYYDYYNYGNGGDPSSWCPFGINGMCTCDNEIVDCSNQGLSSIPMDLPVTIKQLILRNNQISTINFSPLASYTALEVLDLSSNSISTLPSGIFDYLYNLKIINLSDNPWNCDCNLKWLSIWRWTTAANTNVQFQDASTTNCAAWPHVSMLTLQPASFLPCAVLVRKLRSVASTPTPIQVSSNWTSVCYKWFSSTDCQTGYSEAASCVLSLDTLQVELVQYSSFTMHTDAVACQEYCFASNFSYHAFENATYQCLCGEAMGSNPCNECTSSGVSSNAVTMCQFMRISEASHILSDVAITFISHHPNTSTTIYTHYPVTFTISGFSDLVNSISWTFGDGAKREDYSVDSVSHTYFYPGLFPLSVELCWFRICRTVGIHVRVETENVRASLECPDHNDASHKITMNVSIANSFSTTIKWTRKSSVETAQAGGCSSDWTVFNGRCIKIAQQSTAFQQAESNCALLGGTMLRLNHLDEVTQLPSALSSVNMNWIGAKHNGSVYMWEATSTAAYFLRALGIDRSAGDCLVMTSSGVQAADCSMPHTPICQQDPIPCPLGEQLGSSGRCYYLRTTSMGWEQARNVCKTYQDGDLAMLSDHALNSLVYTSLGVSSPTWMGLYASDLLGHYTWVNGKSLTWTNWASSNSPAGVLWPCVTVSSSGQWQPSACDQPLPFICQYSLSETVTSDLHVAGTADLQTNTTFQKLDPYSQTLPHNAGQTIVMPGVWFAEDGQLLEVSFQVEPLSSDNLVGIQVWRPTCPSNMVVLPPGCKKNVFAECGSSVDAAKCVITPSCSLEDEHLCPLTHSCISSSTPCSCASSSPSSVNCSGTNPDSNLQYTLIGEGLYQVPAAGGSFTAKIGGHVEVHANDILAFQSEGSDFGFCQVDPASEWQQVAFIRVGNKWAEQNTPMSLSFYTKQENYVCLVSAVYGSSKTISLPNTLAYVPQSLTYTFEANVEELSSLSDSCTVEAVHEIADLVWLYPEVSLTSSHASVVYVESGVQQYLVAMIPSGSLQNILWELGSGVTSPGIQEAMCPSVVHSNVTQCQNVTSQLDKPFLILAHTFSSSTSVTLNVSNVLNWKNVTMTVTALNPIRNLVLYHSSCSAKTACSPLVEVKVSQQFLTSKSSGNVDVYRFEKNGTVVQSSHRSKMSHTFDLPAVYLMSVNASNGLNSMEATLEVTAKVRAQTVNLSLEPSSPMYVKIGENMTFSIKASVADLAEVNVTSEYGDGTSESNTYQASGDALDLTNGHVYSVAGTYDLKITVQDAFGEEVNVTSVVHVLSVIDQVTVSVNPLIVPAGNSTAITITSQSLTSSNPFFGNITYTINFQDGSSQKTNTNLRTSKTFNHVFQENGTYPVSIRVQNQYSDLSQITNVAVQSCPTKVTLSYDGPKNISEQLIFTAKADQGSDLSYSFVFGDGSPAVKQTDSMTTHTYTSSNTYNASVIASNDICTVTDSEDIIVMDASTLVVRKISHDEYVAINETVSFTVDVVTLDMQKVSLDWLVQGLTLPLRGSKDFNFTFGAVNNYTVSVTVRLDGGPNRTASTFICVQEKVAVVTLMAPSLVSYTQSQPALVSFQAYSINGTDVNFRWYNNGVLLNSKGPNITLSMSSDGLTNITVVAFNEVSEVGTSAMVDVQQEVEDIVVVCKSCLNSKYVALHQATKLECTYHGTNASTEWTIGAVTGHGNPFTHSFNQVGTQSVHVNVSNLVSSKMATFDILVEESVSAVTLVADKPVTGEGTSVQLTASHLNGTTVIYMWQCDDNPPYNTSTSVAQALFATWGLHTCNVTAANNVSSEFATVTIQVLQNITSLGIKGLAAGNTLYVPISKIAGVEADCNTYFGVNFTWTVIKAGAVINMVDGPNLTYPFPNVDQYNLTLRAQNAISSLTIQVNVRAMEEIHKLRLTANQTELLVGDGVKLTAVSGGTNASFQWSVDGMPLLSVSGDSFPYSFSSAGTYVIEVNASNPLNSQQLNITILVQYAVQDIYVNSSLDLNDPFVNQNSKLTFQSGVSQGSDPDYHWTVTSPSSTHTHTSSSLRQTFSEIGEYSILLLVSNAVSQANKTFVVYVEKAITNLNITMNPSSVVATGGSLNFVGITNTDAFPVSYTWTVNGNSYTTESFFLAFPNPGIYPVKLVAHNNISVLEETEVAEVQDPVTGLQLSDCNVTRQAGVLSVLSASAQGTNISFSWIVQLPTQNRTSLGPVLTLTFPSVGSYPVHLLAGNKVRQETLTCTIIVQEAITNVAVHIDSPPVDYIFTNQNVSFRITGDHLISATYIWDFEGLFTINTNGRSYTTIFNTAQLVTLKVTVYNDISRVQVSTNFTVQDLQCNLPIVTRVGSDSRTVQRSKTTQFDVNIDNKGCTQYAVTHSWKIYDAKDCTHILPTSSSLSLRTVDMDKPTLVLPLVELPATSQRFCVHYILGYERTPVAEEVFYNLTVESSPLVALIRGGQWRQVDGSSQVCLNGSASYNPDQPDTGSTGMIFTWVCQVTSGSGSCFPTVSNSSSSLCVSSMVTGTYDVTLTVSLPGSTQLDDSTTQTLEVWVTTPPILSVGVECVSCQATGDYRISSSHHVALSTLCQGCGSDVTYTWSVTENGGTPVTLGPHDTSTGSKAANLVILRNTVLKDGLSYTFMVTVDSKNGSFDTGKASIALPPNLPPSGGVCTASPDSIIVLQEQVTVSCSGWTDPVDKDAQLLYEIKVVQGTQSYLVYYGVRNTQQVYLAPWPESTNSSTQMVVSVLDDSGARTVALSKWITFRDSGIHASNISRELYQSANTTLTLLMQQRDPVPLFQYSLALTFMLNSASAGSLTDADIALQASVRSAITLCVTNSVPVDTLQEAQQAAYLLQKLTEYSVEYKTSGCHTLAQQSLQQVTSVLQKTVRPGLDRDDYAFPSLYSTIYNLIQAVDVSISSSSAASPSLSDNFPQFVSVGNAQSLDFSSTAVSLEHRQSVVSDAFSLAENVTSMVLQAVVLDEDKVTYKVGDMVVQGERTTPDMVDSFFEQGNCRFQIPDSMFSGLQGDEEILKVMIMKDSNPYTWGFIDQHIISTRVPSLSFKYTDGTDLPVEGLGSTIEIIMFDDDGNNYSLDNGSLSDSSHYNPLAYTSFETWTLEGGQSKKLEIDAEIGSSSVSALHVMVRVEALPNSTDLHFDITPNAAIKAYLGVGVEASESSFTAYKEITTAHMASGVDHRLYTFYVSEEEFNVDTSYSITLINEDTHHKVNISSSFYLSSCQYYDTDKKGWSITGCTVSDESIPMATVCHCNHLTSFGGSSLVPISKIRFSDLAALELGLNPVTLVAVCTILLLYIIGVVVCRRLDQADLRRISLVPLCGRDGVYKYHITVITGRQIGAGTSAHIGIKLYGENGKSEARHLTKNSAFQRNSRDTFLIAMDNDVGSLHKVRVWHDNTGSSPSWYLTQLQVQDLQSGQCYVFPANTWLSLEQEDGMLQTEICAADQEELHSFSRVFRTSLTNSMAERHMWISVFNRPDHSRFTRVQRISCCVTLVYLYMFLNAMWYGLIKDQSEATAAISWYVIGWEEVLIALVSVGMVFPVALVLICIFKRSRSKADVFTEAMRPQSAQTLEIDAMCDVSQYGGSVRTMTPNDDWSTIFERESTTTESIPPISSQLRRTTAVNRSNREMFGNHSSFPGSGKKQSTVQVIRRTQELMWNQENILKSWPEKLPSFAEEEREKGKSGGQSTSGAAGTSSKTAADNATPSTSAVPKSGSTSISGTAAAKINKSVSMTMKTPVASALKKSKSVPSKSGGQFTKNKPAPPPPKSPATTRKTTSFKTDTENDSDDHEEFMQRLDQIDKELTKSASIRSKASMKGGMSKGLVKKHSSHSSHSAAIDDLFESDDEWAAEGMEGKRGKKTEGAAFNPRQDPSLDRRASMASLGRQRGASMHVPSSAGSSFMHSTFMRDSTFNSCFMMSEKSRTTLSALLKNRMQLLGNPTEDSGYRLPWFCVYVGYAICTGLSLLSILMILLYGYNFGSAIALQWLLSVLLAFICSMLILEPLKVVILALYVAIIVKDAEKDVEADSIDVMPSIEANEQLKEVKFRPLGGFALLQAHKEGRKKIRLRTMIRQTLVYLLLTATVLAVANVYFGPDLFRAGGHMENSFVFTDTKSTGFVDFYNISTTDGFWNWAKDVWTPALYRQDLVSNEENPVLLGPARLRQIRSTMVDCLTNKTNEVRQCVGRREFTEDTATYSPGWLSTVTGNASWVYSSAEQLDAWPKFGQDLFYTGGGYVQEVGTSYNQTLDMLQQLDDARWLDRRSRALFLEWTSYSAGEDVFCAATLLLEFPISGGVLASHNIQTQRLYVFNAHRLEPLYVCQVLMLLPALYLLIQSIMTVCEQKSQFVRSPGNWLQILICLLCLACVGVYVTCVISATDTLERFSDSSASFTNFEHALHLHDILRLLHACLIFVLFIKIAGQVRFIRPLSVYPRTLAMAFSRLCGATFIFLILLLTYTQLGYLFYGSSLHGYRSFQNALVSMIGVMKGSVNLVPELENQRIFTHFFFYSFYAFVYGLFVALVIAILQDAYKLTRSQMFFKSTLEPQDYEMIEFMLKQFKLWTGIIKPKPAFRRVQFEGQPSLPSRGSSSATSSRRSPSQNSMERNTPTPDLMGAPGSVDALDRLLPAWEKLLNLLGTMESLEKEEQRHFGRVQIAFNRWTSNQDKKAGASGSKKRGGPAGKPPVDPKSKFSRFRLNFQSSNSDKNEALSKPRQAVTPPPVSSNRKQGATNPMMRTLSDQGAQNFGLPERPSSDSQRIRVSLEGAGPFSTEVKDTFPGSSSQRSRQGSEDARTRPGVGVKSSAGQKGSATSTPLVKRASGISVHQSPKLSHAKVDPEDSKKQAWDG